MAKLEWAWAWGASRNHEFVGVRLNDDTDSQTRARSVEWLHDMHNRGADLVALRSSADLVDWNRNLPYRGISVLA